MTTANDLVEETRRHLFSGQEEEANRVTSSMLSTDTSFAVQYPLGSMTQRGAIVAIGLEEIRVWATDNNLTVTVCERGVNGTTATTHSANDYVAVRPKFSNFRILKAINEDLADLSSPMNGMYQVTAVDLTYNPAVQGYDITNSTTVIRVLEARYQIPGPSNNYPEIRDYSLQRNMPTATFPSGNVFDVYRRAFPGLPIHLRYAAPYGTLVNLTDDVLATTGLQVTAHDLPPLGATIRLVAPRELKRNFTEAGVEPRRADEVPPGSVIRSILGMQQLRLQRIKAEAANLQAQFPYLDTAV